MDPRLSRRYLRAMGVQVWRLRVPSDEGPGSTRDGLGSDAQARASSAPEKGAGTAIVGGPGTEVSTMSGLDLVTTGDQGAERMGWGDLQATVASCRACGLCESRARTVFGVGDLQADLMLIGEAPGADEDRQGEPFVGRAGRLLNEMLAAIGLERGRVYIANILKCRPPGNRDPRPEEVLRCQPFLMRQIALVRPRVLLSVGRISAQTLLATDTPIGRLRGHWFEFGPERTPLTVIYHPAYLLRSPDQKARAWKDLIQVARRLRDSASAPRSPRES